jgi:hypothetical protein
MGNQSLFKDAIKSRQSALESKNTTKTASHNFGKFLGGDVYVYVCFDHTEK